MHLLRGPEMTTCGYSRRLAPALLGAATLLMGAACDRPAPPDATPDFEEAVARGLQHALSDLATLAPEDYTPYLATDWLVAQSSLPEPIPPALLRELQAASGLPARSVGSFMSNDSTSVLLYLTPPRAYRSDSVSVWGGWMGFVGGDGGGSWGIDYDYLLDCSSECLPLAPRGTAFWN